MLTTVRFTVDEYIRLASLLGDRRTELIDGQIVLMPSIGTAHYTVVQRLTRMLAGCNAAGLLLVQLPLVLGQFDEPEPDLAVLSRAVDLRKATPDDVALLIEVADTSYDKDREMKLPRYVSAGVPLVWIVNISNHARPQLEVYTSMPRPDSVSASGVAELPARGVAVDLDVLFDGIEALPPDEYPPT